MSQLVEFDSLAQIEVLLRAGMELKFELADDSDVLVGSPIYASSLNRLREGLISGFLSSSTPGKARGYVDWYRLDRHRDRWSIIARRAVLHPHWKNLSGDDLQVWIETLAAPLVVDDETLAALKVACDQESSRG
jgi:hypothetical protein